MGSAKNLDYSWWTSLKVREKTNILAEPRITFLRRELLLEKSTKNSLNFWQTRITLRNVILVCQKFRLFLVGFSKSNSRLRKVILGSARILVFSLTCEKSNSRTDENCHIRGEKHTIRVCGRPVAQPPGRLAPPDARPAARTITGANRLLLP